MDPFRFGCILKAPEPEDAPAVKGTVTIKDQEKPREGSYPAVKAVERRVEIETETQAVYLQKHLSQKQTQENKLCIV